MMQFHLVTTLFAAALLAISATMVLAHVRERRGRDETPLDADDRRYYARRHSRRMQTSVLIGVVGLLFLVGQAIAPREHPNAFVFFWCTVALVTLWTLLMAASDVFHTRLYLARLARRRTVERAQLMAEYRRAAPHASNGAEQGERR